jgi:hypothetical protein
MLHCVLFNPFEGATAMEAAIHLSKMTTEQKLLLMEEIWNDLLRNENEIPSPGWHGEVLKTRLVQVREGSAGFTDWESARKQLREELE